MRHPQSLLSLFLHVHLHIFEILFVYPNLLKSLNFVGPFGRFSQLGNPKFFHCFISFSIKLVRIVVLTEPKRDSKKS